MPRSSGVMIPQGTRFGTYVQGKKNMVWEDSDRDCQVKYRKMTMGLAELETMETMVGPGGPLHPGSVVYVDPKNLRAFGDTQPIIPPGVDPNSHKDLSRIIIKLQEELYDVQRDVSFWYSASLKRKEHQLKKRIELAKEELDRISPGRCDLPEKPYDLK